MPRPPALPVGEKVDLVLAVLGGEMDVKQAAARAGVSEQAVGNWRRQFIAAGAEGMGGKDRRSAERERNLTLQISELKAALGEAHLLLRRGRTRSAAGPARDHPLRQVSSPGLAPRLSSRTRA